MTGLVSTGKSFLIIIFLFLNWRNFETFFFFLNVCCSFQNSHSNLCEFQGIFVFDLQDSSSGNVSEGEGLPDGQEEPLPGRQRSKDKAATPRKDASKRSVLSKSVPGYKVEEKSPWLRFLPEQPLSPR